MPSITGAIVIVGSRILVPVDIATTRSGFVLPVVGTVSLAEKIGTIETVIDIGTVELLITTGTVGTLRSGNVTASVSSGVVDKIGSILSGVLDLARHVGTIGTISSGNITASVSSGVVDQARYVGTIGTIAEGKITASVSDGVLGLVRYAGTVDVIGSLKTSGTLPVSVREPATVVIRDQIVYTTILASLSPSTVSGTFISPSVDALYYPGGVGFSIAYIAGENVTATTLIENSIDNTLFRTVATAPIATLSQYDAVFSPTRRYMRFTAINYSTLSATIDAVISLMPPGAH
jgi:hypothetical protein